MSSAITVRLSCHAHSALSLFDGLHEEKKPTVAVLRVTATIEGMDISDL
jgi:hypothetical protein